MIRRSWLYSVLIVVSATHVHGQNRSISVGIFTGVTSTYVWDEGVNRDPRYEIRYDVKFAPIGFSYGIDYEGFGFIVTPSFATVGQKYNVINVVGGHDGIRSGNLGYFNLPIAFKAHIIDLSFFKISFVAGGSVAFLLKGNETISHNATKLRFPKEVYPILPPGYEVEYDGVVTPEVTDYVMLQKSDFNSVQYFAAMGFRSDWDVSDHWRVSVDLRANFSLLDPRTDVYLERLYSHMTLYDLPGKRKDIVASLNIGISRYVDIDHKDANRKKGKTSSFKSKSTRTKSRKPKS